MAIEPNIIPLKSASRDSSSSLPPPVVIRIIRRDPVEQWDYQVENGTGNYIKTLNWPSRDDEWGVYENPDLSPYKFELYRSLRVVEGTVSSPTPDYWIWQRVQLFSETIDTRTGEPWDPNAGFYNPLAS